MGLAEIHTQTYQYNSQVAVRSLDVSDSHESRSRVSRILAEVLQGLHKNQKILPSKLFYDQRGSLLFDQICELEEYYLTRTEADIMQQNIGEMAEMLAPSRLLIEYGSGSSVKTRWMLDHLPGINAYVPVDISREHLYNTAGRLNRDYPDLHILPVCADFTQEVTLPPLEDSFSPKLAYFPGSTLGNFYPIQAIGFMRNVARSVGSRGGFLVGVDLQKDAAILNPAYNDRKGVTAAFNLNILTHLNRECHTNFVESQFEHLAFYNQQAGRIEMHLVSKSNQRVDVNGSTIAFRKGETILTEVSYKFTLPGFARMAAESGFYVRKVWVDPKNLFSIQYLVAR